MDFDRKALTQRLATAKRYQANMTDGVYSYLEDRGIPGDVADNFRLGVCDDIYEGRLSIPYLRRGGVVWFNFRSLVGEAPKYKAPGAKHLYNTIDLDIADQNGEIAIAEGELDCITASALCGVPCVGIPGATQWKGNRHWRELFIGYQTVWLLADPDEAGEGLAAQILEDLPSARLVRLPGDVNETYLKHDRSPDCLKEYMR